MTLRGKKPEEIKKRLKAFFYGDSGTGKTKTAIGFPKPYIIDTERGCENKEYADILLENGGAIFQTTDFEEVLSEVKNLISTKHEYKTLIIDPLTTIYSDLCQKWAERLAKKSKDMDSDGTEFQRHRDKADAQIRHLVKLLYRLDMNVIITSHMKTKWEKNGSEFKESGNTWDCYKKANYIFDLVLEAQKRGKDRIATVIKTRIKGFPEGDSFKFTYEEIAKRNGDEMLDKESTPEKLATEDQAREIVRLIDLMKLPDDVWGKWLDKAHAQTWDEMPSEMIQKCIDSLKNKLNNQETL